MDKVEMIMVGVIFVLVFLLFSVNSLSNPDLGTNNKGVSPVADNINKDGGKVTLSVVVLDPKDSSNTFIKIGS